MAQLISASATSSPESPWRASLKNALLVISASLMGLTLYLIFMWVPTEHNLGISQRIFYFHVPLAWLGMLSILIVATSSALHLITKRKKWDILAYASAETGVIFITLLLLAGIIWNKPTWGVWWTWDARLTTTLILWFIYVGYIMMRSYGPSGSQGSRYGAVVALIGAVDIPIIYMATVWWQTAHPGMNVGPLAESDGLDSRMQLTLWVSVMTFTFLYLYLVVERYTLRRTEATIDELYRRFN